MISWFKRVKERAEEHRKEKEYQDALTLLHSPDLFNDMQRAALSALFPKAWTHMDNFTQDEIFRIAVTLALFGIPCDSPSKMKTAMDLLAIQKIFIADGGNPMVLKRVI